MTVSSSNSTTNLVFSDEDFKSFGFQDVTLSVIRRNHPESFIKRVVGEEFVLPSSLREMHLIGNLPDLVFSNAVIDGYRYLSLFRGRNAAITVYARGALTGGDVDHPLFLVPSLITAFDNAIIGIESKELIEITVERVEVQPRFELLSHIKYLEGVIYALLTGEKIIVIAENEVEVLEVMLALLGLLPVKIRSLINASINLKDYSPRQDLIGVTTVMMKEIMPKLDEFMHNHEPVIVEVMKNQAFTFYTSSWTKELQDLVQTGQITKAREFIKELFGLVDTISGAEDVADMAEAMNIEYSDAELLLLMKKHVENKGRLYESRS